MKTAMLAALLLAVMPADHATEIEAWRAQRVERLKAPAGWLSLVGLHWIEPGKHTVGKALDNDVVLATGPAHLGTVSLDGTTLTFEPATDGGASIDGTPVAAATALAPDSSGNPTVVTFDGGEANFQVIERGGRYGLRVKDARAPTRTGFTGIQNYAIDPAWRLDATFEAHPPGKTIPIVNVLGMTEPMANPGGVSFAKDGKTYRLEAIDEGDGQYFLIFADRTNKKDTYGAGRFLYAAPAVDGKTVVDFNKAYNPPCAFNAYSTCPLPPPENRLDIAVTAGEKRYAGPGH